MNKASFAMAAAAAILGSGAAAKEQQGPAPRRIEPATKRKRQCSADCFTQSVDLEDGRTVKEVVHTVNCPVALAIHNQGVNTRQVRRHYARTMAKRGAS